MLPGSAVPSAEPQLVAFECLVPGAGIQELRAKKIVSGLETLVPEQLM